MPLLSPWLRLGLTVLHIAGLGLFVGGFLLARRELPLSSSCADFGAPQCVNSHGCRFAARRSFAIEERVCPCPCEPFGDPLRHRSPFS